LASSAFDRFAATVTALELPIVLAIAPVLLFPTPARLVVLGVVPVVWFAAWSATGRAVPRTPMNAPLWLLLVMVGVSLFVTFDVLLSLGKVSGVVLGALLFWAIVRWTNLAERLVWATAAFMAAGAGLAVIGLLGTNWDNKFPAIGAITAHLPKAIRGVPGAEVGFSTNAVAGCLVLFVPLQVALLASGARRWFEPSGRLRAVGGLLVAAQVALLVLTTGTLLLTESRSAWLGVGVATLAFFLWHNWWTRALVAAAAAGLAGLLALLGYDRVYDFVINRAGPALHSTFALRLDIWSRAIRGIEDFPLTGMGMNTFRKLMPALYPGYPYLPGEEVPHSHNHLLQAALDLGIPGLVAYLGLWAVAAALLVTVYRRGTNRSHRAAAGGLGAGLIAHFVFSMTDVIPLGAKVGVLFWLTLALIVSLHQVARVRTDATSARAS
jgi:putative inorganic carbon (HCO3(-)) transporter